MDQNNDRKFMIEMTEQEANDVGMYLHSFLSAVNKRRLASGEIDSAYERQAVAGMLENNELNESEKSLVSIAGRVAVDSFVAVLGMASMAILEKEGRLEDVLKKINEEIKKSTKEEPPDDSNLN